MLIAIILIIIGFILLLKGADFLVDGSTSIAKKFHISELVIGLTIVAMGTSMPELVISLTSAIEGHSDISLGNVVGSNLVNLLFILGICATIRNIEIKKETRLFDSPLNFIVTVIVLVIGILGINYLKIDRIESIILLLLFIAFIVYVVIMAKKGEALQTNNDKGNDISQGKSISSIKAILNIIIGMIALKYGADFVVNNSIKIAQTIGISEKIIGLTIVAIGTSLPELVASITAIRKGENDMAVGNVLGSNIFNILLILGVSGAISPINYDLSYNFDIAVLLLGGGLLLIYPYIGKKNYITKSKGAIFVGIYLIYMFTLIFVR